MRRKHWILVCLLLAGILGWIVSGLSSGDRIPGSEPAQLVAGTTYQDTVTLSRVLDNLWIHESYVDGTLELTPVNGLVVVGEAAVLLVNTTATDASMSSLLQLVENTFHLPCEAVLLTSASAACTAGIPAAREAGLSLFATERTRAGMENPAGVAVLQMDEQGVLPALLPEWQLEMPETRMKTTLPESAHPDGVPDDPLLFPQIGVLYARSLFQAIDGPLPDLMTPEDVQAWEGHLREWLLLHPALDRCIPGSGQWGTQELMTYTADRLYDSLPKAYRK